MKFIIAFAFASVAFAQTPAPAPCPLLNTADACPVASVSFSIQEPESMKDLTGKVIKNYQLVGAEVCSIDGKPISGGRVYEAATHVHYTWQAPAIAYARIARTVNRNWRYFLLEGGKIVSIAATSMTASGAIKASSGWISGLAQAHGIFDELSNFELGQIPNPAPLYQLLIKDDTVLNFSGPKDCRSGIIVIRYSPKNGDVGPVFIQ